MKSLKFFTDGGCRPTNPGPAACAVFYPDLGTGLGMFLGEATNNEAEAEALVMALQHIDAKEISEVYAYSDSQLLVHLVTGWWKASAQNMQTKLQKICDVMPTCHFDFSWVSRKNNKAADWICNQVLDAAERGEYLTCPTLFEIPLSKLSSTPTS